jgi:hypothetical protein
MDYFYEKFAFYRKLVKNIIKPDRLRWLKSTDNNLKSQTQHFWKFISVFKNYQCGSIQLEVDGARLVEPRAVADPFAKHFQSVYNNQCSMDIPPSFAIF